MESPHNGDAAPTEDAVPPPTVSLPSATESEEASAASPLLLPLSTCLLTGVAMFAVDVPMEYLVNVVTAKQFGVPVTQQPPHYYVAVLVYGALAGLCLVGSDHALRPVPRPVRWTLALLVGRALFCPHMLLSIMLGPRIGWPLIELALWSFIASAVALCVSGAALGLAAGRSEGRLWRLALVGAASGAVGYAIERLAIMVTMLPLAVRLLVLSLAHPNAQVLMALGGWVLRGAVLGLILALALALAEARARHHEV